jgi:hypothetical protein
MDPAAHTSCDRLEPKFSTATAQTPSVASMPAFRSKTEAKAA